LKHNADPNLPQKQGLVPLDIAIPKGDAAHIKLLIESGAKVNIQGIDGKTPLCLACALQPDSKAEEIIKLLLENGADPKFASKDGTVPLDIVTRDHREQLVELLKDKKA
jgi:ankyrin